MLSSHSLHKAFDQPLHLLQRVASRATNRLREISTIMVRVTRHSMNMPPHLSTRATRAQTRLTLALVINDRHLPMTGLRDPSRVPHKHYPLISLFPPGLRVATVGQPHAHQT
jgi:hypothetical protein